MKLYEWLAYLNRLLERVVQKQQLIQQRKWLARFLVFSSENIYILLYVTLYVCLFSELQYELLF